MAQARGAVSDGDIFGKWTVVRAEKPNCACVCACGIEKRVDYYSLKNGRSTSCRSCANSSRVGPRKKPIKTGTRFGSWTVLQEAGTWNRATWFECVCDCGNEQTITGSGLRLGQSTKCESCARAARVVHGHTTGGKVTPEYRAWLAMQYRCYSDNPNVDYLKHYGGRGIEVSDEWRGDGGFERFLSHIGPRPSDEHSVDRIDNNGNYEPGNVRWATKSQQVRNRRPRDEWGAASGAG